MTTLMKETIIGNFSYEPKEFLNKNHLSMNITDVEFAKKLGIKTIAEFVDNKEVFDTIKIIVWIIFKAITLVNPKNR